MIAEAEKKAACFVQTPEDAGDFAKSIRVSWDAVSQVEGINVPLRRPNRTKPITLQQELAAWDAASEEAWRSIDD